LSDKLDELAQLLQKGAKRQVPVQTEWCTVTDVDWEDRTMTVESLLNGLEYFDVLLGLGSIYKKPKTGTKCLIGLIANSEACFMIDCEAFEELVMVSDKSHFTIKESGFVIKQDTESLRTVVNSLIDKINEQNAEIIKISNAVSTVATTVGVSAVLPVLVQNVQTLTAIALSNNKTQTSFNKIFVAE